MPGEHTRLIAEARLGLDAAATDRLIARGVLFVWSDPADSTESTS
jgi:hypothetical protein